MEELSRPCKLVFSGKLPAEATTEVMYCRSPYRGRADRRQAVQHGNQVLQWLRSPLPHEESAPVALEDDPHLSRRNQCPS